MGHVFYHGVRKPAPGSQPSIRVPGVVVRIDQWRVNVAHAGRGPRT